MKKGAKIETSIFLSGLFYFSIFEGVQEFLAKKKRSKELKEYFT